MSTFKRFLKYFTLFEKLLWLSSISIIITFFFIFDKTNYFNLILSLLGVTSLIFIAKGNPIGHAIMIIFAIMYGIVSFSYRYYGEMITYLFMSLPMAVFSLISWLKNPYNGNHAQVKINKMTKKEYLITCLLALAVTVVFYFILKYFNTANLAVSTISVTTSFFGAYLTYKRNPYYALGYVANDIILIILWVMATITNITYLSVTVCFVVFLINDFYAFINWRKLQKLQSSKE